MNKKIGRGKRGHQVGPRIVRAWFDTVINPLLRSLELEQTLLAKKHWTWQFRLGGLESLRPVQGHLDPEERDNLDHFLEFHPDIKRVIEDHDKKGKLLLEKCQRLQRVIEESPELHELYQKVTSPALLAELDVTLADLFGAYPESDHLAMLTQHIVNNITELPGYYSSSRLWNKYRSKFMALVDRPRIQSCYEATLKAGNALRQSVERLIRLLKERRFALSLEYDVPPVATGTRQTDIARESFR